ncbi:MAG: DNA/RNA non-specific endonuclease [Rhodopila sp.]
MTAADAKTYMDRFAAELPWIAEATASVPAFSSPRPPRESTMRSVTVTLDINDDGTVSLRSGGPRPMESAPSFQLERSGAAGHDLAAPEFDIPFDTDYSGENANRKGYDPDYLGENFAVAVPDYSALKSEATPLTEHPEQFELKYRDYTSVMHKKRKFPIFTAANVDGGNRFAVGRPRDVWRYDPRIPRSAQVGDFYYANNQFDRGHLTRYRDMQYGDSPQDALERGADTLHFTNCTPQHARFNQGEQLWQGLEQHILEQSVLGNVFKAVVFTGPVLDDGDPEYRDLQYPLSFWKVAVAVTSDDALFAVGFILDQSEVIRQFGIEAAVEVPFPPFKTYQVPIEEIERQTGLRFMSAGDISLSEADPLATGRPARRRLASRARTKSLTESTSDLTIPPYYVPLVDRGDIIRG